MLGEYFQYSLFKQQRKCLLPLIRHSLHPPSISSLYSGRHVAVHHSNSEISCKYCNTLQLCWSLITVLLFSVHIILTQSVTIQSQRLYPRPLLVSAADSARDISHLPLCLSASGLCTLTVTDWCCTAVLVRLLTALARNVVLDRIRYYIVIGIFFLSSLVKVK